MAMTTVVQKTENRRKRARQRLPDVMQGREVFQGASAHRLVQRIGEGSWAVCYAAEPISGAGKPIAVKCVPRKGLDERHLAAIKGELKFHKAVSGKHKNILKIVCVQEDQEEDVLYIGTELCIGGNLRGYVERNVLRGQTQVIKDVFVQIIDGLKALHDNGIYHRDLKPENILVQEDRTVVIGDFGFATNEKTTTQFGMGSPGYVGPEVIRGVDCSLTEWSSPHGDIWAIGIILLNMITGTEASLSWGNATLLDKVFHYYYFKRHRPFFSEIFDVTEETDLILKAIFEVNIEKRISLVALRERVVAVTSFGGGKHKNVATVYSEARKFWDERHVVVSKMGTSSSKAAGVSASSTSTLCSRKNKSLLFARSAAALASIPRTSIPRTNEPRMNGSDQRTEPTRPSKLHPAPTKPVPQVRHRAPPTPPSSESGEDTDGPETPQTIAADAQVAIQDVEEFSLDEPTGGAMLGRSKSPAATSLKSLLQVKKQPAVAKVQTWIRGTFRSDVGAKVGERNVQPMA